MLSVPVVLALLSLVSLCAAVPVGKREVDARAGPSGYVVYPPGNTDFYYNSDDVIYIHVTYQGVSQPGAQTLAIDLKLEDPSGNIPSFPIAYDLANASGDVISGQFLAPIGACGSWNLVFTEHQEYNGVLITFRAAAPLITLFCPPQFPIMTTYST